MDDIVQRLGVQLDQDERIARSAREGGEVAEHDPARVLRTT
ncbi:hypothetical protein [Streptomyces sp. NPDC006193]